jgi:hypothetical protein
MPVTVTVGIAERVEDHETFPRKSRPDFTPDFKSIGAIYARTDNDLIDQGQIENSAGSRIGKQPRVVQDLEPLTKCDVSSTVLFSIPQHCTPYRDAI